MNRRPQGIALVTVLLVVAIGGILAVELMWQMSVDLRRTQNLLERDQAQQIALGLEALAGELLRADYDDDETVDSLNERWAEEYGFPFEGGTVVGRLDDMQGRFNLNSLVDNQGKRDEVAADQFRRLVDVVSADLSERVNAESVVDSVVDWIDPNQLPDGIGGAEDGVYTNRTPPYRAANFWFTTPTELLAVDQVTPELYDRLADLVTALPPSETGVMNVNTAPAEVLRTLSDEVSQSDAETWVDSRSSAPFESIEEFTETAGDVLGDGDNRPTIDVGSQWFGLTVIVSIGSTRLSMYSLLDRSPADGTVTARLRAFDTP